MYSFGSGANGVLGHDNYRSFTEPTYVAGLQEENVSKIVAGWSHVLAMTSNGRVFTWGNAFHEIDEKLPDLRIPTLVQGLEEAKISDIACGNYHNLALDSATDAVFTWGGNGYGQLGIGESEEYLILDPIRLQI